MKNIDLEIPDDFDTPQQIIRETQLMMAIRYQNFASSYSLSALSVIGVLCLISGQVAPGSEWLAAIRAVVAMAWVYLLYKLAEIAFYGNRIRKILALKEPFTTIPGGDLRSVMEDRATWKIFSGGLMLGVLGAITSGSPTVVDSRPIYEGWAAISFLFSVYLLVTGFSCRRALNKPPEYLE